MYLFFTVFEANHVDHLEKVTRQILKIKSDRFTFFLQNKTSLKIKRDRLRKKRKLEK